MSEAPDSRDSENNWVIAGSEGLAIETLGAEQTEAPQNQPEAQPADKDVGPDGSAGPKGTKECGPLQQEADVPASEEMVDMRTEEAETDTQDVERPVTKTSSAFGSRQERCVRTLARFFPNALSLSGLKSCVRRGVSRTGEVLEEVSCSSSDDDVEGLRKRIAKGASPVSIGAGPKEVTTPEEEGPSGVTLNKCIIAALALVGIGFLLLTGGLEADEDSPQMIITRSTQGGDGQPRAIEDVQNWIKMHASHFAGDPGSLVGVNELLDKVAKENQDIRHMQAKLQAQKEELETMLRIGEGGGVYPGPQHQGLLEENIGLKDALLKEETAHLSVQEALQSLQEKMETMEVGSLETQHLVSDNAKLKEDLDSSRMQIEGFLTQKEILVAEAQMLRQELDKQRSLVGSIRQDLETLTAQKSSPGAMEGEQQLQEKISDINSRLALELQRSETWEKTYVEHVQRRKDRVTDQGHKGWRKGQKTGHACHTPDSKGEDRKQKKDQEKPWKEEGQKETQHEEWKDDVRGEHVRHEKKQQRSEGEHHGKGPAHQHHENTERGWKEKPSKHHHEGEGGVFHPRKGQKDYHEGLKEAKEDGKRKVPGEKAHGKDSKHRHHEHNKFWKKLSDHKYRVPEGCSGVEGCARKDGIDLFDMELKPVQRKQFEDVLQSYLANIGFSKHLPELIPLLDGFFEGPVFSHDKIRFRDFVDDVEDFLEGLARREVGNDDVVDDFEKYVYANFFGEAATRKKRSPKKEVHKQTTWEEGPPVHGHHHKTQKRDKTGKWDTHQAESKPNEKSFNEGLHTNTPDYRPAFKQYHHDKGRHNHQTSRPPDQLHVRDASGRYRDPASVNHRHPEEEKNQRPSKHHEIHHNQRNEYKKSKPRNTGDQHGHQTRQAQHHKEENLPFNVQKKGKQEPGREAPIIYQEHLPTSEEKHRHSYSFSHPGEDQGGHKPYQQKHEEDAPRHRQAQNNQGHGHYYKTQDRKPLKEGNANRKHRHPEFYTNGNLPNLKHAGEERRNQHEPSNRPPETLPNHKHSHVTEDEQQHPDGVYRKP